MAASCITELTLPTLSGHMQVLSLADASKGATLTRGVTSAGPYGPWPPFVGFKFRDANPLTNPQSSSAVESIASPAVRPEFAGVNATLRKKSGPVRPKLIFSAASLRYRAAPAKYISCRSYEGECS